jgi:hypothetical protein
MECWLSRRISSSGCSRRLARRRRRGTIASGEDVEQLVFELNAYLLLANAQFVLVQDRTPMDRARRAIERLLASAAPAS